MRAPVAGKCQFAGSDCPSSALPGQSLCSTHIGTSQENLEQAAAAVPATRPVAKVQPVEEGPDPILVGGRKALQLVAEEAKERLEYFEEQRRNGGRRVKRRPMSVSGRPIRKDLTRMVHPTTGEQLGTPGFARRWVRSVDSQGNPSDIRVEEYKEQGYQVIHYKDGDGALQPLKSIFGIAMECTTDVYATRLAASAPVGALNRYDALEDAFAAEEAVNRRAGDKVVSVVAEREHKRRREEYGYGDNVLADR